MAVAHALRLPHEAHETVFGWVLKLVAERGLVKGERIGVDGSTMEANAALRTIVRRDSGESYRAMLTRMAKESGIDTPSAEDLARFDRKRKGKTLSNADWNSPTDRDARIAKMKDETTHLAYKPEHAVDLDTGVVVAAPIHLADEGDTTTLSPTLGAAARTSTPFGLRAERGGPCVVVADKGYHSREQLKALEGGVWKTRIAEPEPSKGYLRWHGDEAARKAVYANPCAAEIGYRARDDAPARRNPMQAAKPGEHAEATADRSAVGDYRSHRPPRGFRWFGEREVDWTDTADCDDRRVILAADDPVIVRSPCHAVHEAAGRRRHA